MGMMGRGGTALSYPVRFGHGASRFVSDLSEPRKNGHSKARLQIKLKQSVPFLSPVFPLACLFRAGRTLLPNRPAPVRFGHFLLLSFPVRFGHFLILSFPVRFGHGASRFVSDLSSSDFSDFFGIFSVTF